jgi:hypothetical protein
MNDQDKQELIDLVKQDCEQVIKFLSAYNLKVKHNKVEMLFSDGEVDESNLNNIHFTNLWELQYEPSLVKVGFIIERQKELNSDIKELLESLLYKITTRGWRDNHRESPCNSKAIEDDYNCFQSIKIDRQGFDCRVILIGAIGYFN